MAEDVRRQAHSFVGTLAQLQDAEKILASNEQAAREALERLASARKEEAEVREHIEQMQAESHAAWLKVAADVEQATATAAEMRQRAQREYDAHVSKGVADGQAAHDGWRDRTIEAEAENIRKRAEVVAIDEEVARHRAVLDDVKREMSHLRARLET